MKPWIKEIVGPQWRKVEVVRMLEGGYNSHALLRALKPLQVHKAVYQPNPKWPTYFYHRVIALTVLPDAVVAVHSNDNKCRTNFAFVNAHKFKGAHAGWFRGFEYVAQTVVTPDGRYDYRCQEICAPGIHFFFDKADAKGYNP